MGKEKKKKMSERVFMALNMIFSFCRPIPCTNMVAAKVH
jgi:hypothetical protein